MRSRRGDFLKLLYKLLNHYLPINSLIHLFETQIFYLINGSNNLKLFLHQLSFYFLYIHNFFLFAHGVGNYIFRED